MSKILDVTELNNYLDFGESYDVDKLTPIITNVESDIVRKMMGDKFYYLMLMDLTLYEDLIDGSTFEHEGVNYMHPGLKAMIADFVMGKYLLQINVTLSPFGAVTKQEDYSEPANRNTLKDMAQLSNESGYSKWNIIELYLNANKELFPNWKCEGKNNNTSTSTGFKFRKIGK